MSTLLFTDPVFERHDTGAGHPECPARLKAIAMVMQHEAFAELDRRAPEPASREQLVGAHDVAHVDRVLAAIPETGHRHIDGDTVVSPDSGEAALKAAGAATQAVDAVMGGEARNVFCAVRPPGHHATGDTSMGFCLFNNVAVAAAHARSACGLERVAVVDFDVHHGNGTQDICWNRPGILYVSSHQYPLYPGTGKVTETGGHENVLNMPLPGGSGSESMRQVYTDWAFPKLREFQPQLLLISAGFDAHQLDPLAGLQWTEDDYAWVSAELADIAAEHCDGRIVSSLEGGYHLEALARSVAVHLAVLIAA